MMACDVVCKEMMMACDVISCDDVMMACDDVISCDEVVCITDEMRLSCCDDVVVGWGRWYF